VNTVTFVSSNRGKFREVADILRPYGIQARWRQRSLSEPQARDLETVVTAKLSATRDIPGCVLVEDSGLFIPSLGGFPGIYSSYVESIWGRRVGFRPFFDLLRNRDRHAVFRTIAGVRFRSHVFLFRGETRGSIAPRPAGAHGFGYDPIFVPSGWKKTFAQGSPAEKNAVSHRARALRQAAEHLITTSRSGRHPRTRARA
jgi:XTP/dITP diphosphohydrolase